VKKFIILPVALILLSDRTGKDLSSRNRNFVSWRVLDIPANMWYHLTQHVADILTDMLNYNHYCFYCV